MVPYRFDVSTLTHVLYLVKYKNIICLLFFGGRFTGYIVESSYLEKFKIFPRISILFCGLYSTESYIRIRVFVISSGYVVGSSNQK